MTHTHYPPRLLFLFGDEGQRFVVVDVPAFPFPTIAHRPSAYAVQRCELLAPASSTAAPLILVRRTLLAFSCFLPEPPYAPLAASQPHSASQPRRYVAPAHDHGPYRTHPRSSAPTPASTMTLLCAHHPTCRARRLGAPLIDHGHAAPGLTYSDRVFLATPMSSCVAEELWRPTACRTADARSDRAPTPASTIGPCLSYVVCASHGDAKSQRNGKARRAHGRVIVSQALGACVPLCRRRAVALFIEALRRSLNTANGECGRPDTACARPRGWRAPWRVGRQGYLFVMRIRFDVLRLMPHARRGICGGPRPGPCVSVAAHRLEVILSERIRVGGEYAANTASSTLHLQRSPA